MSDLAKSALVDASLAVWRTSGWMPLPPRLVLRLAKQRQTRSRLRRLADLAMARRPAGAPGFEAAVRLDLDDGDYAAAARHLALSPFRDVRIRRAAPPERGLVLTYRLAAANEAATGKAELAALLDLARLANDGRDQEAALAILEVAAEAYPGQASILLLQSSIRLADGDLERAIAYAEEARPLAPLRATMRLLSLTAEGGMLGKAETLLDDVAAFGTAKRAKAAPGWNRWSVLFPDRAAQFALWRADARKRLSASAPKTIGELDATITRGVRMRWLKETRKVARAAKLRGVEPSPEQADWLKTVEARLGPFASLTAAAYHNEQHDTLVGLRGGEQIAVDSAQADPDRIVEFFIPQPFYARRKNEKPSYETVRKVFSLLAADLLAREDLILVPRHQYNWRNARPKLDARVISYHTCGTASPRHLRLQESPLSGRCSVDEEGYACFSSIADTHTAIESFTEGVGEPELLRNRQALFDAYVRNNVSKYLQAEAGEAIGGDYVFVALQITTDIVATRAYMDGVELVRRIAEHYRGSATRVVVKRHPFCTGLSIQRELGRLSREGAIVLSEGSIHTLIAGAKAVFTVNSGVGLEALIHLKPVVVTGACDYSYAVETARNGEELTALLNGGLELDTGRALRLLYFYANRYTIAPDPEAVKTLLDSWLESRRHGAG